jgi:membrane protein DedA with SNARE-associated domain
MMHVPALIGLALSTFVSEDLASIGAGLLARDGQLPLLQSVMACVAGVYVGDLGLWLAGRLLGRRALTLPWLAPRLNAVDLDALSVRIDAHLGTAVVVSRFLPGSRLPMYVAAGIWGRRPVAFAAWSFVAVMMWTPLLVVSASYFGAAVVTPLLQGIEIGVIGSLSMGAMLLGVLRFAGRLTVVTARHYHQRFAQTIERPN